MRLSAIWLLALGAYAPALAVAEEPSASVRLAILVADAEKRYRDGDQLGAVELYDQAAAKAFAEGATGRAFELSRTAAAIVQALGQDLQAGARLRRLAMTNPTHTEAPAAHHAAIVCLAQAARRDQPAGGAYAEAIDEFLEQWPDDPAAGQVRWWRVEWLVASQQWDHAIPHLLAYHAEEPRFVAALQLLGSAAEHRVEQLRAEGADAERIKRLVLLVTERIQPLITGQENRWPAEWTRTQRRMAESLARLHMAYRESGPRYPYRLLTAAATGNPPPKSDWLALVAPLLVEASLNIGNYEEARKWAAKISAAVPSDSERLARRLEPRAINGADQLEVGRVLIALAAPFTDSTNDSTPPEWATRAHAVGLLATGRADDAARLLGSRGAGTGQHALFQRIRAQALSASSSEEALEEAIEIWRRIESQHKPGSADWRRGRLSRIELLIKKGDRAEAKKLLDLTRELYPTTDQAEYMKQFEELSQRLE